MKEKLTILLGLVLIPIVLPVGVFNAYRLKRRLRRTVRESLCPECGTALGVEALALADRAWNDHVVELRRTGCKLRRVRTVDAICLQCGVSLRYVEQRREFRAVKPISSVGLD